MNSESSSHFAEESAPKSIEVGSASDTGLVRNMNEDSLLRLEMVLEEGSETNLLGLFAVADGMGGYEGGEVASRLAIKSFAETILRSLVLPELRGEMEDPEHDLMGKTLTEAVKAANDRVYSESQARGNGMGTTLVAALVIQDQVHIANVGDSRLYLIEDKQIRQITSDHSLVASLVAAGEITPEEIYTHPRRNIITRCLGTETEVEADVFVEELKPGSALLLCCDGLWEMVRDDEIRDIVLQARGPQEACRQLVEAANRNGGADNISVIVVRAANR